MRPDDRGRPTPGRVRAGDAPVSPRRPGPAGDPPLPFDLASAPDASELAALRAELTTAGARVRGDRLAVGFDRPDPSFTRHLRTRLTDRYRPAPAMVEGTSTLGPASADRWARPVAFEVTSFIRWAVLAVAAVFVVAVIGSSEGRVQAPAVAARAGEAYAATLVRGGSVTTLTAGTSLEPNDEVRVGPTGHATLELGDSLARLDAGTVVRLDDLAATRSRLELLAGRSYHRVSLPHGGAYTVVTGPLAWTAVGTAFDLAREPQADGTDRVDLLAIEHTVAVTGPEVDTSIGEGRAATVGLNGGAAAEVRVGPIGAAALDDPWLADNAQQDRGLGFPLGVLDGLAGDPTPSATAPVDAPETRPTDRPTATAEPTDGSGPSTNPEPTDRTSSTQTREQKPDPTPKPKPKPTPLPVLSLRAESCSGGIVVDWTRYRGPLFDRYVTVRSAGGFLPAAYPPHPGTSILEGATSTDRWRTSARDPTADVGATFSYRTLALSADDAVIAASPVRSATARAVGESGSLTVGPGDGSTTAFSWTPYAGPADCFSVVKIAWSADDPTPSVVDGAGFVFASGDQGVSAASATLEPGTYHFRVEVLRVTDLGSPPKFVVAHSDVATYTVP